MYKKWAHRSGFALPTILIASFVMLLVLSSTLATVSSGTIVSLDANHYERYSKTAAESGIAMSASCLAANSYTVTWSGANPLTPRTNCSGTVQLGVSAYVHDIDNIRTTFSIGLPTTISTGKYRVAIATTVERLRPSNGEVWRSYSKTAHAVIDSTNGVTEVQIGKNLNAPLNQLAYIFKGVY